MTDDHSSERLRSNADLTAQLLGFDLVAAIDARGWTKQELAEHVQTNVSTVRRWCAGDTVPGAANLLALRAWSQQLIT